MSLFLRCKINLMNNSLFFLDINITNEGATFDIIHNLKTEENMASHYNSLSAHIWRSMTKYNLDTIDFGGIQIKVTCLESPSRFY